MLEEHVGGVSLRGRIFYGWWIVAASFIVLMFHAGAAFYACGRFLPTLIDVLGASTTAVSAAVSVYLLVIGLTGPIVGRLTENYGPKLVLLVGGVIGAAGLMLLSLTSSLWHLYVLYAFVGLGLSAAGFIPASVAISHWFVKRRGLAMGISTTGMSIGAMLIAPLTGYLIESIGWRGAFLVLG
ncbi:MAG: MFS transporter [Chloroflexota bacterium]|nr:MFS transporter [Chloroflexota bacterium]